LLATIKIFSPYQVLTRTLTLKRKDRQPPALGPKVRLEAVHLSPPADETGLSAIVNGNGVNDLDEDGLKEHGTDASSMWQGAWTPDCGIEFELPESIPLSALEVWNFNAAWETTNGIRKADVAVSSDGVNWHIVLRGAEFSEAEGTADYDEPTILKLNGAAARKVRFENIIPWDTNGKVGLSEVVFHEAAGLRAAPLRPEDGAVGVGLTRTTLEWMPVPRAATHRVHLGTNAAALTLLGATDQPRLQSPQLKPGTAYYWRVDEAKPDGSVVTGRVARFETGGLVGWWKLDESGGPTTADSSGHLLAGRIRGAPHWAPGQGRIGGSLEFDGRGNFVTVGNSPALDFRDEMTFAAWIKIRQFDKPWQAIATRGNTAWRVQRNADQSNLSFSIDGPVSASKTDAKKAPRLKSKRNVDDGQWHHVVALYDGNRAALYLDGELEDAVAAAGEMAQDTDSVLLGENAASRGRFFNGWMDDVRLYSYGLSEAEVQALYRGGVTTGASAK
jgi:hypothetical protein